MNQGQRDALIAILISQVPADGSSIGNLAQDKAFQDTANVAV